MTSAAAPAIVSRLIEEAGVSHAIIGGHAVNAWLEPRFTADVDITIVATAAQLSRLDEVLRAANYAQTHRFGDQPSGPDFVRWVSAAGDVVEIQLAKTDFQREVVLRAKPTHTGARVASPEDLVILKLIADRAKDRIDLEGLVLLDGLDWNYIEDRAREWDVLDRLNRVRARR